MKYILIFLLITGCMYEEVDGFRIMKAGEVPISRRELEMSGKLLRALKEKDKIFLNKLLNDNMRITFISPIFLSELRPQDWKKENQYLNFIFNTEFLRNKEYILDSSYSASDSLQYVNKVALECFILKKEISGCAIGWTYALVNYELSFGIAEKEGNISSLKLNINSQKEPRIKFLEIEKKIFQALRENRPELIFQKNLLEEYPCISLQMETIITKSCWDEKQNKVKGLHEFFDSEGKEQIEEVYELLFTDNYDNECPSFQKAFASLKEDDNSIHHNNGKSNRKIGFRYPLSANRKCYYSIGIRGDSPNELKIHDFDFLKM